MDSIMLKQYLVYLDSVRPTLDRIEFPILESISEEVDSLFINEDSL